MPSVREEIIKTFQRLSRRAFRSSTRANSDTVLRPDSRLARQFGPYRIVKRLGFGGMGQVYLALDERLGRHAALKFLSPELTSDAAMLYRLQREARTASALNHPNILTIYEIVELDGEHFIASEYIDGITLRAAMDRDAIDPPTALEVATQVASALKAAHSAGVIHRDLKPGNIMIRSDGYVKVIDFGLAKSSQMSAPGSSSQAGWTHAGAVIGTIHYMSPEQARGEEVDPRTDLWSLGVILYEMLANKRPFEGPTDSHIIVGILDSNRPAIPGSKPGLAELEQILDRALAKDRQKRYQTAGEMLADLRQFTQSSGTASGILPVPSTDSASRRHWALVSAGFAVLFLAIAVWWWAFNGKETVLGPQWFDIGSPTRLTFDGNVRLASLSPDANYLAYTLGDPGDETLRIRDLKTGSESQLSPLPDPCIGLTFSPSSRSLYYVLKGQKRRLGRLYAVEVSQLQPRLVFTDIDGPITFSPDGERFAYVRISETLGENTSSILVAPRDNFRNGQAIFTVARTQISEELAWSPRGNSIAVIMFSEELDKPTRPIVSLYSLDGHLQRQFSPRDLRSLHFPVWLDGGSLLFYGIPVDSNQTRLEQLSLRSGQFHSVPSDIVGFSSISASHDDRTLAAVRREQPSSIWMADAANPTATRMLTPETEPIDSLSWSDSGDLVFPSARGGSVNLWRLTSDGALRQLSTSEPCVEDRPAVVPHQTSVIYSANCGTDAGDFNLWRLDWSTGKRVALTSGANFDTDPAVSPDGKWIVFTSWPSNVASIWKMPLGGGTPERIYRDQARFPAISPDGKQVACEIREAHKQWQVAIVSFEDGSLLKQFPGLPVGNPVRWSPDGSAIDYIRPEGSAYNVWRQSLNGGPPQPITHLTEGHIVDFSWNQDGTKLAYIRGRADSDVVLFRRSH
jgi:eukaryotic-like serine/threonine-protein kinase